MSEIVKYYPVLDLVRDKAKILNQEISLNIFEDLNFVDDIKQANVILVGGGDGFMLDTIHKYIDLGKIFLGANCGTLGFLLNEINTITKLPRIMDDIEVVEDDLIHVEMITDYGNIIKYCVNDIVLGNNLNSVIDFEVIGEKFNYNFRGTGALISTAIGCTGYWIAGKGPLIPLKSNSRGIMGMYALPFDYDIVEPQNVIIRFRSRGDVHVWIDGNVGFSKNIKEIRLSPNSKKVKLGFLDFKNFENRRLQMYVKKIGKSKI